MSDHEFCNGAPLQEGQTINGYKVLAAFDPGINAYSAKALSPRGGSVFFKKYRNPTGMSPWLDGFIADQNELKRRIAAHQGAKDLCYEFKEFFHREKPNSRVRLKVFYQTFEWIQSGKSLRKLLENMEAGVSVFDWKQKFLFASLMVSGVRHVHAAGVIHSDLKPENFFMIEDPSISAKWKTRVIDMDFSLLEGRQAAWHEYDEGYVGTPGYMSPEHLRGEVPGKPSDVFTLGVILGELLGDGHPGKPNLDNYNDQVLKGNLRPVSVQGQPEWITDLQFLNHVINGCFRPEPSRRPMAEELWEALIGRLDRWDGKSPRSSPTLPRVPTGRDASIMAAATQIIRQPIDVSVVMDEPLQLVVEAKGDTLSYIWKKDGTQIPGATESSYSIPNAKHGHAGRYTVRVIGTNGVVESNPAVVRVLAVPPPPPPPTSAKARVELVGAGDQKLTATIATRFGLPHFKNWGGDYGVYFGQEQFRLFKDGSGQWMVEHCCVQTNNPTFSDGKPLTSPACVRTGMKITIGKTRCPITINLI